MNLYVKLLNYTYIKINIKYNDDTSNNLTFFTILATIDNFFNNRFSDHRITKDDSKLSCMKTFFFRTNTYQPN